MTTPRKKIGANQYNYRIKTNKKIGGQYGHQDYHLSKKHVEELIDKKKIQLKEIIYVIKGKTTKKETIKYKYGTINIIYLLLFVKKVHGCVILVLWSW